MGLSWTDWLGLALLAILLEAAVLVFLKIQAYLNHPQRKQINEQWFAIFQRNLQQRYSDKSIRWRAEGLSRHFHRDDHHN